MRYEADFSAGLPQLDMLRFCSITFFSIWAN
jgi:hypothetical protein